MSPDVPARRGRTLAVALALLVALALAVALGVRSRAGAARAADAERTRVAALANAPVEFGSADTLVLAPVDLRRSIAVTGSLRAVDQTVVRSKAAGEIRELLVREGSPVRRGQVIARIDPIEPEQRLREREAQLASAEAQLAQARRDVESNRLLTERGFISPSAFDRTRSTLQVAEAARNAAAANVAVARKTLGDATVVAPIDGIVAERFAQPGEKVSPDNRLVSIVDLSRMELEAAVPAEDVARVRIGQTVEIDVEGLGRPLSGRVARIAPGTQASTRAVPVYVAIDQADPRVRSGLFAQARLALDARAGVLAVPYGAVRDRGGRTFVYVIEAGRIRERDVRTGLRDDAARTANGRRGLVEVTEGLAVGDRVVATDLGTLREGAPARVAGGPAGAADHGATPPGGAGGIRAPGSGASVAPAASAAPPA